MPAYRNQRTSTAMGFDYKELLRDVKAGEAAVQ
jgi:hypothetical protein